MPKSESAQTLLKRLEKIERAQGRLGNITTRILAQAETLADLLKVAQGFAGDGATAKAAGRPKTTKKASTAKRSPRKAAAPRGTQVKRASSPAGATKATPAAAKRRAARRPASA